MYKWVEKGEIASVTKNSKMQKLLIKNVHYEPYSGK